MEDAFKSFRVAAVLEFLRDFPVGRDQFVAATIYGAN
jgi:hypothetical protein